MQIIGVASIEDYPERRRQRDTPRVESEILPVIRSNLEIMRDRM